MPSGQSNETEIQCLFLSGTSTSSPLQHNVQRLWQVDVLPYRSEKAIIRSKQDQCALDCLDRLTVRETVNGVSRYVTPLLRSKHAPLFNAPKEAVMSSLLRTEHQLTHNPGLALIYEGEKKKTC